MEFGKLYLTTLASVAICACSGCAETSGFVDYASLEAVAPDFQAGANPAYQVDAVQESQPADAAEPAAEVDQTLPPVDAVTLVSAEEPSDLAAGTVTPAAATETSPTDTVVKPEDPAEPAEAVADVESLKAEPSLLGTDPMAVQKRSEPLEIKLLVQEKRFRTEGEDNLRVSYDDIDLLKILNMEPVPVDAPKYFPDWLKELDGKRIRIRGFMYPTFEATGLKGFTLARDNGICCFVRQPMIYDIIGVDLAQGVTTNYIDNKPFDVEGVFQIAPEADDTELFQLYRITDAKVLN